MNRYLVCYFNGLIEANIMVVAESEKDAMQYVEEELRENEDFQKNHCFGENCFVTGVAKL